MSLICVSEAVLKGKKTQLPGFLLRVLTEGPSGGGVLKGGRFGEVKGLVRTMEKPLFYPAESTHIPSHSIISVDLEEKVSFHVNTK